MNTGKEVRESNGREKKEKKQYGRLQDQQYLGNEP